MDKKLFLFDCDGVLVDSLPVFEGTVKKTLAAVGRPILKTREDFLDLFEDNFYTAIARRGVDLESFIRASGPILAEVDYTRMKPFPGLLKVVAAMSREHLLVVISSGDAKIVEKQLIQFGFNGHFADILGADFLLSKIDKINHAVAKFQTDRNRTYYVGDTIGDILEAKKAGVKTIAVSWGWHGRERLASAAPDYLVDNPEELLNIV